MSFIEARSSQRVYGEGAYNNQKGEFFLPKIEQSPLRGQIFTGEALITKIANLPKTLILRHPGETLATLGLISLAGTLVWNVTDGLAQAARLPTPIIEQTSDSITPSQTPLRPPIRRILTTSEYINLSDQYVDVSYPEVQPLSIRQLMRAFGHNLSKHQPANEAFMIMAGKDGLYRRSKPTAAEQIPNRDIYDKSIYWGETVNGYALALDEYFHEDGSKAFLDVFILIDPRRVTEIPEDKEDVVNAPNKFEGKLYEPAWARLARVYPDGTIERYATIPEDPGIENFQPPLQGVKV